MARNDRTLRSAALRTCPLAGAFGVSLLCAMLASACSDSGKDVPATDSTYSDGPGAELLQQTQWQVTSINGEPLVDGSVATVVLGADGQLAGDTSCNRYFGRWSVSGSSAKFEPVGVTRRACEQALMEQERLFLDALEAATRIEQTASGNVFLRDDSGASRLELAAAEAPPSAVNNGVPQDLPGPNEYQFHCAEFGTVTFRFLGPDTIELMAMDARYVLHQERAASGARYASESAEFWNKGNEALLTIGENRYNCERSGDD